MPAVAVRPPRVAENPIHFECRVHQIVPLTEGALGGHLVIVGWSTTLLPALRHGDDAHGKIAYNAEKFTVIRFSPAATEAQR